MTDKQRLLGFFRSNPNREVNAYTEIVGTEGLRILEYTGRISDVRKDLGCTCGEDRLTCLAEEHIINTRKGYYKFVTPVKDQPLQRVDTNTLKSKRNQLASEWLEAKKAGDESAMKLIEVRGRAIKNAIEQAERLNVLL